MKLFTVGYEGYYIEDFTEFLKKKKIAMVVDVRKNPISRKKGFSKNKLREALAKVKIDYVHFVNLGVPSAWRQEAKKKIITRKKMFWDYVKKILPKATADLKEILQLAKKKNVALLCYEADANDCHRHFVGVELQNMNKSKIKITDL